MFIYLPNKYYFYGDNMEEKEISKEDMVAEEPELEPLKDEKPKKNIVAS